MQRRISLFIKLALALLPLCLMLPAKAQVNIRIDRSNINSTSIYQDNQSLEYAAVLSVAPTINVRATNASFTKAGSLETISPSILTVQIIGSGGQATNLLNLGSTQPAVLSTNYSSIYVSLLALLQGGLMNLRYAIPNAKAVVWKAGTYTNKLDFQLVGVNLATLKVLTNTVNISVSPFIAVDQPQQVSFAINDLNYFRNKAIPSQQQNFLIQSTVKPYLQGRTESSTFSYTGGYAGANIPAVSAAALLAQLKVGSNTWPVGQMSNSYRNLSPSTGHELAAGNTNNLEVSYSLSPELLKTNFMNKGSYLLNLKHLVGDAEQAGASAQELSSTAQVVVSDMAEIKVNHTEVALAFKTAQDYRNGVTVDLPAHFSTSATAPYDVYVQASSSNMSSGSNSIPVSILRISAAPGNTTNVTPVTLKTTRQKLMTAMPAIDHQSNIRYSIDAAESAKLLGKPPGAYTTTVTYSMVAP